MPDVRVPERKARPLRDAARTFVDFSAQMMQTRDIDPIYPVLRELNDMEGASEEDALWRTLCYVAVYNIAASEVLYDAPHVNGELLGVLAPKSGVERRGMRSPLPLSAHLSDVVAKRARWGSFRSWLTDGWTGDPKEDWRRTRLSLEAVAYNGRWASFKTCDILAETHGWPIEAPDAGHTFSSGPRQGLAQLVEDGLLDYELPAHTDQSNEAIERLDRATDRVQRALWVAGVPVKVAEVETLLCNWHAFRHNDYYVGHDIDEMQGRILASHEWAPGNSAVRDRLWKARRRALPVSTLGEVNGWVGIRKELMGRL